jgi:hypothetical protein
MATTATARPTPPDDRELRPPAALRSRRRAPSGRRVGRHHLVVAMGALLMLSAAGLAAVRSQATASKAPAKQAAAAVPKPADLDRALAPIALYPDAILGQMLLSAANPGKVATLAEWLRSHDSLKGTALQDAAKAAGFSESYVAIAIFPTVVEAMAKNIEATTLVGSAFGADPSAVFASVQRLRKKAQDAGKLKTTPQQEVETRTTSSGQQVIVIEPANPQVMYVPQYNPQTVYTTSSTTVVVKEDDDADAAVAAGLIGFTAGIAIGAAIDNDYYYGPYGYRGGFYMYDDAWDDWYDHREDAREDWADHREDLAEERGDRAKNAQEERTDRAQTRNENRPENQTQRASEAQARRAEGTSAAQTRRAEGTSTTPSATATSRTSTETRGYSRDGTKAAERTGKSSDAFSGYSSGKSERAASSRGKSSRSSSRGGGGRRR